jgi:hypothetical protein
MNDFAKIMVSHHNLADLVKVGNLPQAHRVQRFCCTVLHVHNPAHHGMLCCVTPLQLAAASATWHFWQQCHSVCTHHPFLS